MPTAQPDDQITSLGVQTETPLNPETGDIESGAITSLGSKSYETPPEEQEEENPNTGQAAIDTIAPNNEADANQNVNDLTDLPLKEEPIDQKRADFLSTIADNMEKVVTRKIWEEAQKNVN